MIPSSDAVIAIRLETNELIERERFSAFLAAIEEAIRNNEAGGPGAILLVGGVRHGSVELVVSIAGTVMATALAVPGFLVALKELSKDKRAEPNTFATSLGEIMVGDAVQVVEFRHKDKLVSIRRDEVPYVGVLGFDEPWISAASLASTEPLPVEMSELDDESTEDEDQDWVPTLEASDAPPREAAAGPSGSVAGLTLAGEFVSHDGPGRAKELRFVPHDPTLADYFVVASAVYDAEPMLGVPYHVTGNITLDPDRPAIIEVLSILPQGDSFIVLRT